MPIDEKDVVRQPLMSTGTTEPGFKTDTVHSKPVSVPKIGETVIGDEKDENKG
ncbi:hypothetical protein SAMN05877753_112144 [Bacillus oleivorans]|uniref:Uncharacterized protein n=1 Tax=Bacillus oleivorans TaxID=1448271 RepID=A0A285D6R6_9BACI|nr:hypothetical protein [Bacillus oleivorans]SNX75499.1 hypothetical protein SAMN05877753_112144 [Bacillus oleivorans]